MKLILACLLLTTIAHAKAPKETMLKDGWLRIHATVSTEMLTNTDDLCEQMETSGAKGIRWNHGIEVSKQEACQ